MPSLLLGDPTGPWSAVTIMRVRVSTDGPRRGEACPWGGLPSSVDYTVDERINRQGYAIFEVTESYSVEGEDVDVALRCYVRRIDGEWDLDGIEVLEPGAEPIT